MKKIIIVVLFLAATSNTFSQTKNLNGVYLTSNDFINGKIHLKGDKKQVRVNEDLVFNPTYVRVKTEGKKYFFHKDSIWGVSDNKDIYRFANSNNYTLIANSGIMLYLRRVSGRHMRIFYYFSENASSPILPLTIQNLEKSYVDNKKFHDLLHSAIIKDEELATYDEKCKSYRIVNIYKLSLEK
jgi:hypothetical protein